MNTEDNFKNLCDLTTNLVGLPKGSLALKTRKIEYHVPRMIAAMVARIEDRTHRDVIAKVLDREYLLKPGAIHPINTLFGTFGITVMDS